MNDEFEIRRLSDLISMLERRIADLSASSAPSPYSPVFIAEVNGTSFTERAIVGGALSTFTDGRASDLTELESTDRVIVTVRDGDTYRYVEVGETCVEESPITVGAASEGTTTASTDVWADDDNLPLDLWFVSRVVYDDATDETLYAFMRKASFSSCGKLIAVSAETKVTVDAPGDCP